MLLLCYLCRLITLMRNVKKTNKKMMSQMRGNGMTHNYD